MLFKQPLCIKEGLIMKEKFKDYLEIILGSTIFSLALIWFADPMELVIGGVSGISIIVKKFAHIPL